MTLQEATITALLKELGSRCPALVVGLLRPDDKEECETITFTLGNRSTCLGLSHLLVSRCEVRLGMRPELDDYDAEDHPAESGE